MSRYFRQPKVLDIIPDSRGQPLWLRWPATAGRERVTVCNAWRMEGAWWQGQTAGRAYYTLITASRAALVVFHDEADGRWYLEKVID